MTTISRGRVALAVLLAAAVARADGPPAPLAPETAAAEATAAWRAKDVDGLRALAGRDDPDPWLVADALLAIGEAEAAAAFAAAAPRADVRALPAYLESRKAAPSPAESRGRVAEAARALGRGEPARALEALGAALPADDVPSVSAAWTRALALRELARPEEATRALEEAAAGAERIGWLARRADALGSLGILRQGLGDLRGALRAFERAAEAERARENRRGEGRALGLAGSAGLALGEYARALAAVEGSLAIARELGDRAAAVEAVGRLGILHAELGDRERALAMFEEAVREHEALGSPGLAGALVNLGEACRTTGRTDRALEALTRALDLFTARGDRRGQVAALGSLANLNGDLGRHDEAERAFERSLALSRELGESRRVAETLGNLARLDLLRGRPRAALARLDEAILLAEELGVRELLATSLGLATRARLELGEAKEALALAHRHVEEMGAIFRGLSEERAARGRQAHAAAFDYGFRAAVALGDVDEAWWFAESGRAATLLEGLGGRAALASWVVPAPLLRAETDARGREAAARRAWQDAARTGDRKASREARRAYEEARQAYGDVLDRIQREARAAAGIVDPRPAPLAEVRAALRDGEALVLYAMPGSDAWALVVTRAEARIVTLGSADAIREAARRLIREEPPYVARGGARGLRDLVLAPLGLPEGVGTLLLSAGDLLAHVPFALLDPDRTVASVPSGTLLALLRSEAPPRGESVLAVGDPDYAGRLPRLPASADEARSVGDVVLLGADATEERVLEAIGSRPRWRAVHVACHGHLDPARAALSSLALTPSAASDGAWTTGEVFRARVPADLVVLSACETGRGRFVFGEGILGLPRAFLHAGSPRVIVSLWKVDDEATRALMVELYRLWNPKDGSPGMEAAAALRAAQAHVRSQERWKHPSFWAAWVLWGLP